MTSLPVPADQPATESPHVVFREGLQRGELLFQRCAACEHALFPPTLMCPYCGATELSTEESVGTGAVYSTTTITSRDADSYCVTLVDLDEGFRMLSTVVGIPAEDVRIGQRVVFEGERGDEPRATFRPEATE